MFNALCTSPEGIGHPLTQADPMFGVCGGWGVAHPANTVDGVGRMDTDLIYDDEGRLDVVDMQCGNAAPHQFVMSYDDEGRHVRRYVSALPEYEGLSAGLPAYESRVEYVDGVLRTRTFNIVPQTTEPVPQVFEYDDNGFLMTVTREAIVTTYEHDDQGRLVRQGRPPEEGGHLHTYEYEGDQLVRVTYAVPAEPPGAIGGVSTFTWEDGRIVETQQSFDNGLETVTAITRDDDGRVVERARSTTDGDLMNRALYEYDDDGRWVHYEWWGYHDREDWGTEAW